MEFFERLQYHKTTYKIKLLLVLKMLYLSSFNGVSSFLTGNQDEFAIFNTELSSADALAIYGLGQPTDLVDLSPVAWYRFEEGSGTTAIDSGTGGNNGTLENSPTYSTDVPT